MDRTTLAVCGMITLITIISIYVGNNELAAVGVGAIAGVISQK